MGSIGVASGDGRMNRAQLDQIRGRAELVERLGSTNTIIIWPGKVKSENASASARKWGERLGLSNSARGYAISMTGATRDQKERFLKAVNSSFNLTQNRDSQYKSYADRLVSQARAWKAANGRGSLTKSEERVVRELANSTKQRATLDRIIQNDRNRDNKLFGGMIKTRRLTKRDR